MASNRKKTSLRRKKRDLKLLQKRRTKVSKQLKKQGTEEVSV